MCINAARSCGLECAGVDLMKDKTGKSYIIEINGNYGYLIEEITKVDISTPLIKYCEKNHKTGNLANQNTTAKLFDLRPSDVFIHRSIKTSFFEPVKALTTAPVKAAIPTAPVKAAIPTASVKAAIPTAPTVKKEEEEESFFGRINRLSKGFINSKA